MVEIQVHYEGALRCRAVHGPSGRSLETDAPVDNHGRGESFSPTDLVAAALGTCMLTVMGIAAERRGWSFEGASASLVKEMSGDAPRRVARVAVEMRVPGEWTAEQRAILEEAARSCPVSQSIHASVETPLSFTWGAPEAVR